MAKRDTRIFKRPRSPYWYGRVPRGDGTYCKRSLGTENYEEARRRLRELDAEVRSSAPDPTEDEGGDLTIADALVECEAWHEQRVRVRARYIEQHGLSKRRSRPPGCSRATAAIFVKKARHLNRLLGEVLLSALHRRDLERYIETRRTEGASSHTIHKELVEARKTLKLAHEQGHALTGSVADIVPRFDPEYEPRKTVLTPEQVDALLDQLPEHRRLWVVLAVWLGARLSGVERLTWAHIDLKQRLVTLPETKTANSFRTIPISRRAFEALTKIPPHARDGKVVKRWVQVQRDLAKAAHRAKVPRVSPNDLRRTFGSWLYNEKGVDADKAGHLMGHADGRMVRRTYGQISRETERKMMDLLPD